MVQKYEKKDPFFFKLISSLFVVLLYMFATLLWRALFFHLFIFHQAGSLDSLFEHTSLNGSLLNEFFVLFILHLIFSRSAYYSVRVVEKFISHIICDNCRLRSYRHFSLLPNFLCFNFVCLYVYMHGSNFRQRC